MEWTRMVPESIETRRNDTEIYWNDAEWDWNEHEYGRLNLKWAKCDVFFLFFFLMGAGEAFHVLSVNNFVSFWQVHRVMTNQNKVEHMWANLKTCILIRVAVCGCFSHASAAFFYTSGYTSHNLIIARQLYPISCFLCFSWLVWAMESQRKLPR